MNWTAETAGLLARYGCPVCQGAGLAPAGPGCVLVPCGCVCKRVFRACYRRFRRCASADGFARLVTFTEYRRGVDRHLMWIRRNEDYCADFQASGKRVLNADLYCVFRFYHLLGGSADLVSRRLGVSRTTLYELIGEIEEEVGREFALMEPYSLYPPQGYIGSRPQAQRQ